MVVTFFPATLEIGVMQERVAVDMHGTRAAKRHATAELRAGLTERVTKHPKERHICADIYGLGLAVQSKADSHGDLLKQAIILQHFAFG
jgi:hypothetical protein